MKIISGLSTVISAAFIIQLLLGPSIAMAWEPTKPIEFVIPAGTGGGADQMARLMAGISDKHKLSPRPFIVVNKSGGAGAEGFPACEGKEGRRAHDHHYLVKPVHHAAGDRARRLAGAISRRSRAWRLIVSSSG